MRLGRLATTLMMTTTTIATTIVIFAGCSLFTDLGGLSNGNDDGGGSTTDASNTDGGPSSDAEASTDAVDAGPDAKFCAAHTTAIYCVDFDEGQALLDDWTFSDISPSSKVTLDPLMAVSPPRSLRSTMPTHASGIRTAQVGRSFPVTERRPLRVEMDVFLVKPAWPGTTGNVTFLFVGYLGATLVSQEIFLINGSTSITTRRASTPSDDLIFTASDQDMPTDVWTHIKLETDLRAGSGVGSVKMWFGTPPTLVVDRSGITFTGGATDTLTITPGLARYNGTTPAMDVRVDNIVLEYF